VDGGETFWPSTGSSSAGGKKRREKGGTLYRGLVVKADLVIDRKRGAEENLVDKAGVLSSWGGTYFAVPKGRKKPRSGEGYFERGGIALGDKGLKGRGRFEL